MNERRGGRVPLDCGRLEFLRGGAQPEGMAESLRAANIRLKRAYDAPAPDDGQRILVDRLWPRGVSKDAAALDEWMKEIAPSTELRKWFHHDPTRWDEFHQRYLAELRDKGDLLASLREKARKGAVTLIYSARDEVRNDAVVLRDLLLGCST